MAKHYTYTNTKRNKVVFETVQPNYVSTDDVAKMVLAKIGTYPRLAPALFERSLRVVDDNFPIPKKKKTKKRRGNKPFRATTKRFRNRSERLQDKHSQRDAYSPI